MGAVLADKEGLRDHYLQCEGGPGGSGESPSKEFQCGACGQQFSSHFALDAHKLSGGCHVEI